MTEDEKLDLFTELLPKFRRLGYRICCGLNSMWAWNTGIIEGDIALALWQFLLKYNPDRNDNVYRAARKRISGAVIDSLRSFGRVQRDRSHHKPLEERVLLFVSLRAVEFSSRFKLQPTPSFRLRVGTLSPRENLVIQKIYFEDYRATELANELHVTQGYISQLHTSALHKLRRAYGVCA